ncbi:MAG: NADH-quinone oxidoreductase subunit C [Planctomycetes bacterium]|nr:NADH-quinone oxidoreductase subunit C [Planctomycetota bacterium]
MPFDAIITALKTQFAGLATSEFRDNRRIVVAPAQVFDVLTTLKDAHGFDMLFEMTAADYLKYPNATDRFGVVYGLLNTATGERLFVKTFLNDPDPTLPSAFPLWKGADWLEREIYDMYGILFDGHPDLRRILMPDAFTGYPLRKDYPLRGRGERHNFPVITRAES